MNFIISILILLGCNPFQDPFVSNPKVDNIIKSGNFIENTELQSFPIFNCQSQVQNTLSVERSRTLEQSVRLNFDAKKNTSEIKYLNVIISEVGTEYGWTSGTTRTDSGGFLLNAAPQSYPIYNIIWRQRWETGFVVVTTQNGTEQIPYQFLSQAHPEIQGVSNIQCTDTGYETATAMAEFASAGLANITSTQVPVPTTLLPTEISIPITSTTSSIYDDFNNPVYDGHFNSAKWSITEDYKGACNVVQQGGHLTIAHTTPSLYLQGCDVDGSFNAISGNRFHTIKSKMFSSNNFQGTCCGYLSLILTSSSFSGGGGWIECGLNPRPGGIAGNFGVKHKGGVDEFSRNLETTYNNWHTIRLQIDQANYTVSCYIDDKLIGEVIPKDAVALKESNFKFYLQAGWPKNSVGTYYLDDIEIIP
jgi:hypothetical protein